jgi:hypothetical protein
LWSINIWYTKINVGYTKINYFGCGVSILGLQKLVVYIFVSGTGGTVAIGRLSALNNGLILVIFFDSLRGTVARGGCGLKISGCRGGLINGRPGAGDFGISGLGQGLGLTAVDVEPPVADKITLI